jgi:hypothetical protein
MSSGDEAPQIDEELISMEMQENDVSGQCSEMVGTSDEEDEENDDDINELFKMVFGDSEDEDDD